MSNDSVIRGGYGSAAELMASLHGPSTQKPRLPRNAAGTYDPFAEKEIVPDYLDRLAQSEPGDKPS